MVRSLVSPTRNRMNIRSQISEHTATQNPSNDKQQITFSYIKYQLRTP